jgi:hypothetical protein
MNYRNVAFSDRKGEEAQSLGPSLVSRLEGKASNTSDIEERKKERESKGNATLSVTAEEGRRS